MHPSFEWLRIRDKKLSERVAIFCPLEMDACCKERIVRLKYLTAAAVKLLDESKW